MINYFSLFNLPEQFAVDLNLLENNYRKIQSQSHPDRFVTASSAEKLQSMQTATLANEAYLTLKSPALRAAYLLALQSIDVTSATNTKMPHDFLIQQIEWREAIEYAKAAKNSDALESLLTELQAESKNLVSNLKMHLDEKKDVVAATDAARKLIFIDKVCADIHKEIEHLEA